MVVKKRRNRWVVDGYIGGRRAVKSFQSRLEAETFKRELRLREVIGIVAHASVTDIGLKAAIRKYVDLVSTRKSKATQRNERQFFETLFEYFGDVQLGATSSRYSLKSSGRICARELRPQR